MRKPWFLRKGIGIVISGILLFILWFQWQSYTTNKKDVVTDSIHKAADSAFQFALFKADLNSYEQISLNDSSPYLIPQFSQYTSPKASNNAFNLQSTFDYYLSLDKSLPLYQVQSFSVNQSVDEVDIAVCVKYELFAGLTDNTSYVQVVEHAPKKPYK